MCLIPIHGESYLSFILYIISSVLINGTEVSNLIHHFKHLSQYGGIVSRIIELTQYTLITFSPTV